MFCKVLHKFWQILHNVQKGFRRNFATEIKVRRMKPRNSKNSAIQHQAKCYTQEQMRLLLCMRDMVKTEVKKEVARQMEMYNK